MHAIGLKFRLQLNIYLFNTAADTIYSLFNYNFAVCVFLHPFLITKNVNQVLNEMQWIKKFTFKRDRNKRLITNICAKLCFLSRLSARICLFCDTDAGNIIWTFFIETSKMLNISLHVLNGVASRVEQNSMGAPARRVRMHWPRILD